MTYKITISPRASASQAASRHAAHDVTDRLIRIGGIQAGVDRNDYEWGIATVGSAKATFYNGDGFFDEGGGHPAALFPDTREGGRLRIYSNGKLLFVGDLSEAETREQPTNGTIEMTALSPNDLLRRAVLSATRVSQGATIQEAMLGVAADTPGINGGAANFDFATAPQLVIEHPTAIVGLSCWEVAQSITSASGRLFFVDNAYEMRIYAADGYLNTPAITLREPTRLEIASGRSRLRNEVAVSYTVPASGEESESTATATAAHVRSVGEYGARGLSVNAPWITTAARAREAAGSLATQNALPKRVARIQHWLPDSIDASRIQLLQRINVLLGESYEGIPPALDAGAAVGGAYAKRIRRGAEFYGRIIRFAHRLEQSGVLCDMTLEEV